MFTILMGDAARAGVGGYREAREGSRESGCLMGGVGCRAKIIGFRTEQEVREFWDTHDSAEYFEDMNDDGV